jgi:hypothetical protein
MNVKDLEEIKEQTNEQKWIQTIKQNH